MKNDSSNAIAVGLLVLIAGVVLLSDPQCKRGCRTVGGHLLEHGLETLLASLVL